MAMLRTFIAIELAPDLLAALGRIQEALRHGAGGAAGRWVRPEGIHLTLKFLGEVPAERIAAIGEGVRRACVGHAPFTLRLAGLGCFPHARRPRVVWVGVQEETGQLAALQASVERELGKLGFPPEGRGFTPHLTLARLRDDARRGDAEALGQAVVTYRMTEAPTMRVAEVHVMRSDLKPDGAVYTALDRVSLGSR